MPPPYRCHVFVCTNDRGSSHPRGSCGAKGAEAFRAALKARVKELDPSGTVRINSAGCLDLCEQGIAVVVYPEGRWLAELKADDVDTTAKSIVS